MSWIQLFGQCRELGDGKSFAASLPVNVAGFKGRVQSTFIGHDSFQRVAQLLAALTESRIDNAPKPVFVANVDARRWQHLDVNHA